jgi:neutral ceramidase
MRSHMLLILALSIMGGSAAHLGNGPQGRAATARQLHAGAAIVDITPPTGLSTGGHGPAGAIARGQLSRLYARAIYLTDGVHPLLLISVESFAVPPAFQLEVQRRVRDDLDKPLGLASIVVAATHTHQGPGNYLGAKVYNEHASRVPGYVPDLRAFLVNQIVKAATTAIASVKGTEPASLDLRRALFPLESLRNRSPETFMLNRDADAVMSALSQRDAPTTTAECVANRFNEEPEDGWDLPGCPRLRAVDREFTVIDVRRGAKHIAMLVFAAVHPTVLFSDTPLYSSDFVGLAMRDIERRSPESFVAAFFNGAEGDITARRRRRDVNDLWTQRDRFETAISNATKIESIETGPIESRMRFATWGEPGASVNDDAHLAKEPRGGAAAIGGAEGDRTPLYALGWRERTTGNRADEGQGAKLEALKSTLLPSVNLTWLLASPKDFPRALPFTYATIGSSPGPFVILTAPTEVSTTAGYRIRERFGSRDHSVLIGLANEYASYTATAEEYARQDYMGASTLWGPGEAKVFENTLANLRLSVPPIEEGTPPGDYPGTFRGSPFTLVPYDVGEARAFVDEDFDLLLKDASGRHLRDLPYFIWHECNAQRPYDDTAKRHAAIFDDTDATIDDETTGRLIVILRQRPSVPRDSEWVTIWAAPLADHPPTSRVKFVVTGADGAKHESSFFHASDRGQQGTNAPCR